MKTYGKNKSVPRFGSVATYTPITIDSPEACRWGGDNQALLPNNTTKVSKRPNGLLDRGGASLSDDSNRQNEQKFHKNGKRSRDNCLTEVVKGGDSNHSRYLLDSISKFSQFPLETASSLFVRVPDSWNLDDQDLFIIWLKLLGFKESFLGDAMGFKYPKVEVIHIECMYSYIFVFSLLMENRHRYNVFILIYVYIL